MYESGFLKKLRSENNTIVIIVSIIAIPMSIAFMKGGSNGESSPGRVLLGIIAFFAIVILSYRFANTCFEKNISRMLSQCGNMPYEAFSYMVDSGTKLYHTDRIFLADRYILDFDHYIAIDMTEIVEIKYDTWEENDHVRQGFKLIRDKSRVKYNPVVANGRAVGHYTVRGSGEYERIAIKRSGDKELDLVQEMLEEFMRKSKEFADNTPEQGGNMITKEIKDHVP